MCLPSLIVKVTRFTDMTGNGWSFIAVTNNFKQDYNIKNVYFKFTAKMIYGMFEVTHFIKLVRLFSSWMLNFFKNQHNWHNSQQVLNQILQSTDFSQELAIEQKLIILTEMAQIKVALLRSKREKLWP